MVRDELWPYSSSGIGMRSGWKAGNLKVWCGLESRADADVIATAFEVSRRYRGIVRYAMGKKGCVVWDVRPALFLRFVALLDQRRTCKVVQEQVSFTT